MSEKSKGDAGNKLAIHLGGFILSLPIVIFLIGILGLLNILMFVVILGGMMGLSPIVYPYLGSLTLIFLLGLLAMFSLIVGLIRYTGGIRQLTQFIRGVKQEQTRIERLIDDQQSSKDTYIADSEDQQKSQYQ